MEMQNNIKFLLIKIYIYIYIYIYKKKKKKKQFDCLLRLSQFCIFYGSARLRWMCEARDLEVCKNVVVELSV